MYVGFVRLNWIFSSWVRVFWSKSLIRLTYFALILHFCTYENVMKPLGKKRLRTRIFIAELNSSLTVQFYTLEKKIFQKFGLNTADHCKLYLDQKLFEFFSSSCNIIFGKLSGSCYVANVIPYIWASYPLLLMGIGT